MEYIPWKRIKSIIYNIYLLKYSVYSEVLKPLEKQANKKSEKCMCICLIIHSMYIFFLKLK